MGVRLMYDTDRVAQEEDATEANAVTAWWFPALNAARDPGAKVNAILAEFATHHKCKKPGCGLPVCSICAARISFEDPRQGYWCQTHANITSTLSTASSIIEGPQSSAAAQSKQAV